MARTYATRNPADKSPNLSLLDSDLTCQISSGVVGLVRSTIGVSAGKVYWEETISVTGGNEPVYVGIAEASDSVNNYPGQGVTSWGYKRNGGIWNNGALVTTVAQYTTGDKLGFKLDKDSNTLEFLKNNVSQYTASISAVTYYEAAGGNASAVVSRIRANFGASAFAYSVPVGYNAGIYTGGDTSIPVFLNQYRQRRN